MKQEEIKILIVEDNSSFGESIKEALIQTGYKNTFLALTPNEAIYYNKIHFINCFVIDCLLPQIQGLELALKFKETGDSDKRHFFFMSGVFQKSDVFDEIKQKIDTQVFFSKPFSPDTLISQIDQCFAKYRKTKTSLVDLLFTQKELSVKERLSILSNMKQIHGFALPQVIRLLNFGNISGVLNLSINNDNSKKQFIYFSDGKITFIELNKKQMKDLFGDLLIKKNLLSFEELQPFFNVEEEDGKKIGEKLVEANLISPHMIQIITREQIGIRLMHLIQNTYYNIDFQDTYIPSGKKVTAINQKELMNVYIEYFKVKIPINYIKSIYLNRLNDQIHIKPDFVLSDFSNSTFEKTVEILISIRDKNHSFLSLLNKYPNHSSEVYFIVHLLLLSKKGYLQIAKEGETAQVKILRLKKILGNLKNQSCFEILNVSGQVNISEIKQSYKELSVIFYPNAVNSLGSNEVKNLLTNIFHEIKTAYDVLSDAKKRKDYELSLEYKNLKVVLESKQLFLEAKKALDNNNKKTALELFRKLMKVDTTPAPHVLLYFIWSQIANFSSQQRKSPQQIEEINSCFDKILPEHRNTALFYFVKGLLYKILDNKEMAISHLKYAYHLDPSFTKAKQEMRALSYNKKPINILKSDLKDIIKAIPFFKKKAG